MANKTEYTSAEFKNITQIEKLYQKAKSVFDDKFWDALCEDTEKQHASFNFDDYPKDFLKASAPQLHWLVVSGTMSKEEDFYKSLEQSINKYFLPENWWSSHSIGFCERNSKQNKKYYDVARIKVCKNRIALWYESGSMSKFEDDEQYQFDTLNNLIKSANLPIEVIGSVDSYTFNHTNGGFIDQEGGIYTKQPPGFEVELTDINAVDAALKLKEFVAQASTGKIFDMSWDLVAPLIGDTLLDDIVAVKKILANMEIPADSYVIDTSFFLQSFEAIAAIQQTLNKKDEIFSRLFQIEYEDHRVNCEVMIYCDKYILNLEAPTVIDINDLNHKLGTSFKLNS